MYPSGAQVMASTRPGTRWSVAALPLSGRTRNDPPEDVPGPATVVGVDAAIRCSTYASSVAHAGPITSAASVQVSSESRTKRPVDVVTAAVSPSEAKSGGTPSTWTSSELGSSASPVNEMSAVCADGQSRSTESTV